MIGGATTSRAHTALKIAPAYAQPVVWSKDASRAVGVAQSLLSPSLREPLMAGIAADYAAIRARHANRGDARKLVSLAQPGASALRRTGTVTPRRHPRCRAITWSATGRWPTCCQ